MKEKKILHKNVEICKLSKQEIDTTKEKYAIILECDGDNVFNVSFWKHEGLLNLIKGNLLKVSQIAMQRIGNMASGMLRSIS